jgi:probable HAF family extracellular repeat protein
MALTTSARGGGKQAVLLAAALAVAVAVLCLTVLLGVQPVSAQPGSETWKIRYSITDLGTLGGGYSSATSINNRGQVVGYSETGWGDLRPFLWQDGKMTDLGTLPGGDDHNPGGIPPADNNDRGQVVGESSTAAGETHAVLWSPRTTSMATTP